MAIRYRSAYRRYLFYRRMRLTLTILGGLGGMVICYLMYENLVQNGLALGRREMFPLIGVMVLATALPWFILTAFVRRPSDL